MPDYAEDANAYALPIPKLVKEKGDKYLFGQQVALADNKGYSLTSKCKNPEMALQFFDWFFTDKGVLLSNYGIQCETYDMVDSEPQFNDFITNNPNPNLHMMFAVMLQIAASPFSLLKQACRPYENQPVADTQKPPGLIYSPGGLL